MKKKFTVLMILVLTAALSLTMYSFADNTSSNSSSAEDTGKASDSSKTTTTAEEPSTIYLSLEDALSRVEDSYKQIVLDDRYIEILDKQYREAVVYQDMKKYNIGNNPMEVDDAKILKLNAPIALYNLESKKHEREVNLRASKVTITNEYQNILAAQLNVEYINEEISKLKKEIDTINAKIKVGSAKASDINPLKTAMGTCEANLSTAQINLKSSMLSLKDDLGIGLDTEVILTSKPIEYEEYNESNIGETIRKAIEDSYSLKDLKKQIDNTQIEYEIYDRFTDSQKDATEIKLEGLKNQLSQMPNTLEVQLRTQYNNLKAMENTVEADKLSIEAAEINLKIAEGTYKVGQKTYLDVLNAQLELSKAKNTLQQDLISYMTAVANFKNSLEMQ